MEPEEIEAHERRLRIRRVQHAIYGINTPPEIIMEIQDIEKKLGYTTSAFGHSNAESYRAVVQSISENKNISSVELLASALLIATKLNDQSLELFCYHELVGWDLADIADIPDYRVVQGFFEVPMNWRKAHRFILSTISSNDCKVLVRDSLTQLEKRVSQAVDRQFLAIRDIDRMQSGDMERVSRSIEDIVDRQFPSDDDVRVYVYIYNYDSILKSVKSDLNKRLILSLASKLKH